MNLLSQNKYLTSIYILFCAYLLFLSITTNSNYLVKVNFIDNKRINVLIEWKEAFTHWEDNYLKDDWYLYDSYLGDGKTVVYVRKSKLY